MRRGFSRQTLTLGSFGGRRKLFVVKSLDTSWQPTSKESLWFRLLAPDLVWPTGGPLDATSGWQHRG